MSINKIKLKNSLTVLRTMALAFAVLTALVGVISSSAAVKAQTDQPATAPLDVFTNTVLLPLVNNDFGPLAARMGYGATTGSITRYSEIKSLKAGWYTDWNAALNPVRPGGIEYAQMIRVHQKLSCGDYFSANRTTCPYAQPTGYNFSPDPATIQAIAQANPGSTWLIGNEMDRLDFNACTLYEGLICKNFIPLGQDEMTPDAYALAYHDLYTLVKAADPSARVAIGGLIEPTPLRLQWLTIAWDTYKTTYNTDMPVDIWNMHNFILREVKGEYGAEVPPGLPKNPTKGQYTKDDWTHINHEIFDQQIRAMRQWMKDRGQQQKPLVISEYGVLYSHCVKTVKGVCTENLGSEQVTQDFMLWTFDYFLNTKDCNVGDPADDCRLVQRWLWFSLDHVGTLENGSLSFGANPYASFFNSTTLQIQTAGQKFRQYVQEHFDQLLK